MLRIAVDCHFVHSMLNYVSKVFETYLHQPLRVPSTDSRTHKVQIFISFCHQCLKYSTCMSVWFGRNYPMCNHINFDVN